MPKSQVSRHLTPVTGLSDVDISMCWIRDRPGVTKERAIASQASVDTDFGPVVARFSDQNVSCVTLCSEPKANCFAETTIEYRKKHRNAIKTGRFPVSPEAIR